MEASLYIHVVLLNYYYFSATCDLQSVMTHGHALATTLKARRSKKNV